MTKRKPQFLQSQKFWNFGWIGTCLNSNTNEVFQVLMPTLGFLLPTLGFMASVSGN